MFVLYEHVSHKSTTKIEFLLTLIKEQLCYLVFRSVILNLNDWEGSFREKSNVTLKQLIEIARSLEAAEYRSMTA